MQTFQTIGGLIGGLGIFLLAMKLMTDGLKLAGGAALKDILGRWTRTPLRGMFSGIVLTAVVQSSAAVTVATIGFVNAGMMTLVQAIGVVYGTNIGTTMTAWLIAALGLNIKVELFALPMIGVGMGLWFAKTESRSGAIGQAIGGFGLFFIGIDILKSTFESLAPMIDLQVVSQYGAMGVALMVGIGFILTVLTQSSSAAIAITLTAATGGIIAFPSAAAMVIGANVGTTSTAFFAALNATPNAKRVASAHVIFNVATGAIALLILPLIIILVSRTSQILGLEESPAIALALFHTIFNVLGVALMWPLLKRMTHWLSNRFRTLDETESKPQFIDKTVAATPSLAINALLLEVNRIGGLARKTAVHALSGSEKSAHHAHTGKEIVDELNVAVGEFSTDVRKSTLHQDVAELLPQIIRLSHYYTEATELVSPLSDFHSLLPQISDQDLRGDIEAYLQTVRDWLAAVNPQTVSFSPEVFDGQYEEIEESYHQIKDRLLRAGLALQVSVRDLGHVLDHFSTLNRVLKRHAKAAHIETDLANTLNMARLDSATSESNAI